MQTQSSRIIQGGMGVAVSSWRLARAVSLRGQLGVVSGTAIDHGQVRRSGELEPSLVTAGDEAAQVHRFLRPGQTSYSANDVLDSLLGIASPAMP